MRSWQRVGYATVGLEIRGIPPFAKSAKDPNFLHAAPRRAPCAAFIKESRMKFVGSPKPNRKFGLWGTRRFVAVRKTFHVGPVSCPRGSAKPVGD